VLAGLAWAPIGVAAAVGLALLLLGAIIFTSVQPTMLLT
jgi:hypothetical protein